MGKVKIDAADRAFSLYIRTRDDWTCRRCGKGFRPPTMGLHCSHYYGRGRENTRFDPENADALCYGCHQHWGSADKEGYREYKVKQLGQDGFDSLTIRANTYCKKDRKMRLIEIKALLAELDTDS